LLFIFAILPSCGFSLLLSVAFFVILRFVSHCRLRLRAKLRRRISWVTGCRTSAAWAQEVEPAMRR